MGRPIPQEIPVGDRYEPVRIYDKPGIALNQLMGGPTLEGFRNLAFNADRLSPTERQTLGARIQEAAGMPRGQSRFTDAVVGAATNPLVWMFFLLSPPALGGLAKGGQALARNVVKGPAFQEFAGVMDRLGFGGAMQATEGTYLPETFTQLNEGLHRSRQSRVEFETGLRELAKKAGVTVLDPTDAYATAEELQKAKELSTYIVLRLAGNEDGVIKMKVPVAVEKNLHRITPVLNEKGRVISFTHQMLEGEAHDMEAAASFIEEKYRERETAFKMARREWTIARHALEAGTFEPGQDGVDALFEQMKQRGRELRAAETVGAIPDVEIKEKTLWTGVHEHQLVELEKRNPGFREMYEHVRQGLDKPFRDLLFPGGVEDTDTMAAILHSASLDDGWATMQMTGMPTPTSAEGRKAMSVMAGPRTREAVKAGLITKDQYKILSANLVKAGIQDHYMPINTFIEKPTEGLMQGGRVLNREEMQQVGEAAGKSFGRVTGRTEKQLICDPDFPDMIHSVFNTSETAAAAGMNKELMEDHRQALMRADKKAHPVVWHPQKWINSVTNARADMGQLTALMEKPSAAVLQSQKRLAKAMVENGYVASTVSLPKPLPTEPVRGEPTMDREGQMWIGELRKGQEVPAADITTAFQDLTPEQQPIGGVRVFHALGTGLESIRDKGLRSQVATSVARAMGRTPQEMALFGQAFAGAKAYYTNFVDSKLGKAIEGIGPAGQKFIGMLRKMGDPNTPLPNSSSLQGRIAKYIYTTHLGINLSSALINSLQPLAFGSPVFGFKNTLQAFGDAFTENWNYFSDRISKYGGRMISHEERLPLLEKNFKFYKQMGMDVDFMHQMDEMIFNGRVVKNGGLLNRVEEAMMKTFEYSERLNRSWAAHTMERAYINSGRVIDEAAKADISNWVKNSQFVSDSFSTPGIFQSGPLAQPLLRTFMSFPIRSAYLGLKQMPGWFDQDSYWKGLGKSLARGLGASALVYEVGKGLFGADLSRGLYGSAVTDVFGGERFLEDGNDWIPVPPVIQIPKDIVSSVAQGDERLFADAILRMMPGGVAVGKMLGVAPHLPSPLNTVQKGYAGWQQPLKDGRVPVYSPEGKLVDFRSPAQLVMQGLGVDLGASRRGGELDGYLVTQREEILKYRQEYVNALLANDMGRAERVQMAFGKRFKDPVTKVPLKLSVTQGQLKRAMDLRSVPRPERILDTMPPEARAAFGNVAAQDPSRFNVPTWQLQAMRTAGSRNERERPGDAAGGQSPAGQHGGHPLLAFGDDLAIILANAARL